MKKDKVPFWRELYNELIDTYGLDNLVTGVMLGGLVTVLYLGKCKKGE